jgi:hypothetical protein
MGRPVLRSREGTKARHCLANYACSLEARSVLRHVCDIVFLGKAEPHVDVSDKPNLAWKRPVRS